MLDTDSGPDGLPQWFVRARRLLVALNLLVILGSFTGALALLLAGTHGYLDFGRYELPGDPHAITSYPWWAIWVERLVRLVGGGIVFGLSFLVLLFPARWLASGRCSPVAVHIGAMVVAIGVGVAVAVGVGV